MPFIAAGIAAVITAVGTAVASAAAAVGLAGLAAGITSATISIDMAVFGFADALVGAAGLASAAQAWLAVGAVAMALVPQPHINTGAPVEFKADINAPLPYVVGRTGTGGNIVFVDTSDEGHNAGLLYKVVLSHGPVNAITQFTGSNVPVTFSPTPNYAATSVGLNFRGAWSNTTQYQYNDGVSFSGSDYICVKANLNIAPPNPTYWAATTLDDGHPWVGQMFQAYTLGAQPDVALPVIDHFPEWTSAHKLSGLAAVHWQLLYKSDAFAAGTPKPLWIVEGPSVYDPRQDSTYPGGSGPQRWNQPTTWAYSENPFLQGLTWLIGHKNNGVKVLGVGAPADAIDLPAYVEGANVADANGWKAGGVVTAGDSRWDALGAMLQAGGGMPIPLGAKISCLVNAPRTSIATLTGADAVGPASIQATVKRADRINRVVPSYREESLGWQLAPAAAVEVSGFFAGDGGKRTKGLDWPLVQDVDQVSQLAAYAIYDSREFGPISLPAKPQWMGLQPGDAITLDEDEWGLSSQLCLITNRKIDPSTGIPQLTLRSETTAKHAAALGRTGALINPPPLTGIDLVSAAPGSPPWSAVGTTLTANGVSVPAIVVTGSMENPNATNLIVEYRIHGTTAWTHYDSPPAPAATRVEMQLASGQVYDVRLRYLVRGIAGDELVIASVTAGTFVGSGGSADPTTTQVAQANISASNGNPTSVSTSVWTVSGCNEPVSWVPSWTGTATCKYSLNGGALTATTSGAGIAVNNGDTLQLTFSHTTVGTNTGVVTVANATDSGANVLTTASFSYSLTVSNTISSGTLLHAYTAPGAYSITSASTWPTQITRESWGGGGGSDFGTVSKGSSPAPGAGGGGGEYVKEHLTIVPGTTTIAGVVGAGGVAENGSTPATDGGDTTSSSPNATVAHGGTGAAGAEGVGGSGTTGTAAESAGRDGGLTNVWDGGGAGNGSGDQTTQGAAGTFPGGGAAGAGGLSAGANGGGGQVILTAGWI
ncbi:MAG TPA: hypothetical protein VGG29_03560 [Caulobacteraceae bacterium]|jgi:hypothetical protein